MWFMQNAMAKPDNAGAGATDYMHLFGLVAMGYMWAKMAKAAQAQEGEGDGAADKMDAKLLTGRFFMERMMPETARSGPHRRRRGHDDGAAGGDVLIDACPARWVSAPSLHDKSGRSRVPAERACPGDPQ